MPADPLRQALRLRRRAVATEQHCFALALDGERAAAAMLSDAQAAIRREIAAASDPAASDAAVEALGLWLTRGRAAETAAAAALLRAEAATARARALLAAARSAEAAVAALIEARAAASGARAARSAQAALDEAALRPHLAATQRRRQHKA